LITNWNKNPLDGYSYYFIKTFLDKNDIYSKYTFSINLFKVLKNKNFDVLMICGWSSLLFVQVLIIAYFFRIPVILRAESNDIGKRTFFKKKIRDFYLKFFFHMCNKFLAIGTLNEDLIKRINKTSTHINKAFYCIDNAYYQRSSEYVLRRRKRIRDYYDVDSKTKVLIWVGKLIYRKRVVDVLYLMKRLSYRKDIKLFIIGSGPLEEDIKFIINKEKIKNIIFVGFKNFRDIRSYYYASDIHVMTSEYETWGLVINEAMASGLVNIVSDNCGGSNDLILQGITGFTYRTGDVDGLAKLVLNLLDSNEMLEKIKCSSKEHIRKFSFENYKNEIENCINSIKGY
jgi:glycosyltransferase involved in cell wall biosynthesis